MVNPVPPGVDGELLGFFRSISANPALIKNNKSNVKHICGYDSNPGGWRLLATQIRQLPHIQADHLTITASNLDGCSTIADIEGKLQSAI